MLVLLAVTAWQLQRDANQLSGNLTPLDPARIQKISLTVSGAGTIRYEKHDDGHWWRSDGMPHQVVDDNRLVDLTDTAAAHVLSWRPASDFDPAKIGLTPPQAVLVLDGYTLEFGETSVTGPQHYVRVGERIALVSSRYMPRSPEIGTTPLQ